MTTLKMIKSRLHSLITVIMVALAVGCAEHEQPPQVESLNVVVSTKMEQTNFGQNTPITSSRLIIIDVDTWRIIQNKTTENGLLETIPGSQSYNVELAAGNYMSCFVINESQAMSRIFDNAATYDDLKAITVEGNFDESTVPFSCFERFMLRRSKSAGGLIAEVSTDGGSTWSTQINLSLQRTQCKVSLNLRKKAGFDGDIIIKKVELCEIPEQSFLIAKTYDAQTPLTRVVYDNPSGISLGDDVVDGNEESSSYTVIFNAGGIFAEKLMSDVKDNTKATYLKIYATCGSLNPTYIIKLRDDLNVENYNLKRNTHYNVYGTITQVNELVAKFEILPWKDGGTIEVGQPDGLYYLNISKTKVDYPNTLYVDHNGGVWEKDATGNYVDPKDFDCLGIFWTNSPSSSISLSKLTLDSDTSALVSITNSLKIVRDIKVDHRNYDVMGEVRVHISGEELKKGPNINYSMHLKTDKIDRKLSFTAPYYDYVPYIATPEVTTLKTLNIKNSVREVLTLKANLPSDCSLNAIVTADNPLNASSASRIFVNNFLPTRTQRPTLYDPKEYTCDYFTGSYDVKVGTYSIWLIVHKTGNVNDIVYECKTPLKVNVAKLK